MPEIWYLKKAIIAAHRAKPIELLVNMHNTENSEYIETQTDDEKSILPFTRLFDKLRAETIFDPSRVPTIGAAASHGKPEEGDRRGDPGSGQSGIRRWIDCRDGRWERHR